MAFSPCSIRLRCRSPSGDSTCPCVSAWPGRYRLGKEIDLHDAIWRLDNAPVEGFEEFVGSCRLPPYPVKSRLLLLPSLPPPCRISRDSSTSSVQKVGSHTTIRVVSDSAHVETRMRPSRETILQIIDTKVLSHPPSRGAPARSPVYLVPLLPPPVGFHSLACSTPSLLSLDPQIPCQQLSPSPAPL